MKFVMYKLIKLTQAMSLTSLHKKTGQQILRNPLNNSTSKYQFSFSKSERFLDKGTNLAIKTNIYYDLPSTKSKRAASFGISNKTSFAIKNNNPSPNAYNLKSDFQIPDKKIIHAPSFGFGREQMKRVNAFIQISDIPGPGSYQPNPEFTQSKISLGYSLGKKLEPKRLKTQSPGPGAYTIKSPLLFEERILSNDKRVACPRLVPIRQSQRVKTQQIIQDKSYQIPKINFKGNNLTYGSKGFSLGKSDRFPNYKKKADLVPGPGYYSKFSEFVDSKM